jgi:hypothetical protein
MNAILPCSGWSNWENKKSLEKIREWLEISSCAFSPIWGLLFDAKSAHFHLPIWIRLSLSNSIECRYWETVFCVLLVKRKRKKTGERIHRSPLGHSASVRRVPVKCIYNGETFGFGMLRANRHNAPHFSLLDRHPILPRLSGWGYRGWLHLHHPATGNRSKFFAPNNMCRQRPSATTHQRRNEKVMRCDDREYHSSLARHHCLI